MEIIILLILIIGFALLFFKKKEKREEVSDDDESFQGFCDWYVRVGAFGSAIWTSGQEYI